MKIGVLGTGMVGRAHCARLSELGHDVVMGTRDVVATRSRGGEAPFQQWSQKNTRVRLATFREAAEHGEVVLNATNGAGSLNALTMAGAENLDGKVIIDISNPPDLSGEALPSSCASGTDSLGERIQKSFPEAKVVKALNTVDASLQVNPKLLSGGDHCTFVSGNDPEARSRVASYLKGWYGWEQVVDLGDLTAARDAEMLIPMWLRLYETLGTSMFNFKVVRPGGRVGGRGDAR